MSNLEELEKLAKLKESGVLTEEEFQEKKKEILSKGTTESKQDGDSGIKELTEEQRKNLSIFKVHKIKKPKEYGGWSHLVYLWVVIPIIGFIYGIIGMTNKNEIKKVQGKAMLLASILGSIWFYNTLGGSATGSSSLACSSNDVTGLVTDIAKDEMAKYAHFTGEVTNHEVQSIRTTNTNKQTGALECAANLAFSVNSQASSIPITYTVEITDNKEEIYVNVFGLD